VIDQPIMRVDRVIKARMFAYQSEKGDRVKLFGIEVTADFSGKQFMEEAKLIKRYHELADQTDGIALEDMDEAMYALSEEQTDIFCELHYKRGIGFRFHR
jgi:hypothetical protein